MVRVTTRRGTIELAARQDNSIPDGMVFIPFAFVEAAANLLTNPALDPLENPRVQIFRRQGRAGEASRGVAAE